MLLKQACERLIYFNSAVNRRSYHRTPRFTSMRHRKENLCSFIDFGKLMKSFKYAGSGFVEAINLRKSQNLRIHCASSLCTISFAFALNLSRFEVVLIILLCSLVISAELMNTAVEILCDYACSGKFDERIRRIKDISAASVLVLAICSLLIAFIIFIPALLR